MKFSRRNGSWLAVAVAVVASVTLLPASEGVENRALKDVNNWYDSDFVKDCDFCVSYLAAKFKVCAEVGKEHHDCEHLDQLEDCDNACEVHAARTGEKKSQVCQTGSLYGHEISSWAFRKFKALGKGPPLYPRCWKIHRSIYSWGSMKSAHYHGCFTTEDPLCKPEDICEQAFYGEKSVAVMSAIVQDYDPNRPDDWYEVGSDGLMRGLILDAMHNDENGDKIKLRTVTQSDGTVKKTATMGASRATLKRFCSAALPEYMDLQSRTLTKNPCETMKFAIDLDIEEEYIARKCIVAEQMLTQFRIKGVARELIGGDDSATLSSLDMNGQKKFPASACYKSQCPLQKLCSVFTASFKYNSGEVAGELSCGLGTVGRGWEVNKYNSCGSAGGDIRPEVFSTIEEKYPRMNPLQRSDVLDDLNKLASEPADTDVVSTGGEGLGFQTSKGSAEEPMSKLTMKGVPRFRTSFRARARKYSDDTSVTYGPVEATGVDIDTLLRMEVNDEKLLVKDDEYAKGIPDEPVGDLFNLGDSGANKILEKAGLLDKPVEHVVAYLKGLVDDDRNAKISEWQKAVSKLMEIGYIILIDRNERLYVEELPGIIRKSLVQYQSMFGRLLMKKLPMSTFTAHCGSRFSDRDDDAKMEEIVKYIKDHKPKITDIRGLSEYLTESNLTRGQKVERTKAILEFIRNSFVSYNHFFYRKLEFNSRVIRTYNMRGAVVSAADSRVLVYNNIDETTKFWIKGQEFSVARLVSGQHLANYYKGGSIAIFRLAPQDYHRFHIPIASLIGPSYPYDGGYYSVSPLAVHSPINVFTANKRVHTELFSDMFGRVAYVSIGATCVGSVVLTSKEGQYSLPGTEHGYMAFGGSTVIAIFKKGVVQWSPNLLRLAALPVESMLKMGDFMGVCSGEPQDDTLEERARALMCTRFGRTSLPTHIGLADFEVPKHYQDFTGMSFEEILARSEELQYYWDNKGVSKKPASPSAADVVEIHTGIPNMEIGSRMDPPSSSSESLEDGTDMDSMARDMEHFGM